MKSLKLNNMITVNLDNVDFVRINHLVTPAELILQMSSSEDVCIFGGTIGECEDMHDRLLSYMGADTLPIDALGNYPKDYNLDDEEIRTQESRLRDLKNRDTEPPLSEQLKSSGWQEAGNIGEMLKRAVDENEKLRKSLKSRDETVYYLNLEIDSRKKLHDDLSDRLKRLEPLIEANASLLKALDEKKSEVNNLREDKNNLLNENKRLHEINATESDATEDSSDDDSEESAVRVLTNKGITTREL